MEYRLYFGDNLTVLRIVREVLKFSLSLGLAFGVALLVGLELITVFYPQFILGIIDALRGLPQAHL